MFDFKNNNKVIEGKALTDTTLITQLNAEQMTTVLDSCNKLGMSEKLLSITKNIMSEMGLIKNHQGETVVVNAICFFKSHVKGIGALLDDPEFNIYEIDVRETKAVLTNYAAGGVITRTRDITAYNKSRQFHKDDIECIVPVNNHGWFEYCDRDQFVCNINCSKTATECKVDTNIDNNILLTTAD